MDYYRRKDMARRIIVGWLEIWKEKTPKEEWHDLSNRVKRETSVGDLIISKTLGELDIGIDKYGIPYKLSDGEPTYEEKTE